MAARERAEELRQEAITTLLDEQAAIEEMLNTLGYQKEAATKKRGRPRKENAPYATEPTSAQSEQPPETN